MAFKPKKTHSIMLLEKLQKLGMAASYDSCGGTKEKTFREYGIPFEYQNFIYNCTQSSENVFVNKALNGKNTQNQNRNYGQTQNGKQNSFQSKTQIEKRKLYEKNIPSEETKKEFRNSMAQCLPRTEKEELNKSNKCLLMKVLQDNTCMHDCKYCANTKCNNKTSLEPKELADSFEFLFKKGYTTGLFLSSAVHGNAEKTTEKMIESVKMLRARNYKGYIHMKVLPDTPDYQIEEMAFYANRLSLNIEATTQTGFQELSSTKTYTEDLLRKIRTIDSVKEKADKQTEKINKEKAIEYYGSGLSSNQRNPNQRNSSNAPNWFCDTHEVENGKELRLKSFTTQIILGANEETDSNILDRMNNLYEETSLYRTYFSAFSPVEGTALSTKSPENKKREHILYEVDWLLRVYDFNKKTIEKGLNDNKNFSLNHNVKQSIANSIPELFPLDPNTATKNELLLVPGLGPKSTERILEEREQKKFRTIEDLIKIGARVGNAKSYLNLEGRQTNLFHF